MDTHEVKLPKPRTGLFDGDPRAIGQMLADLFRDGRAYVVRWEPPQRVRVWLAEPHTAQVGERVLGAVLRQAPAGADDLWQIVSLRPPVTWEPTELVRTQIRTFRKQDTAYGVEYECISVEDHPLTAPY